MGKPTGYKLWATVLYKNMAKSIAAKIRKEDGVNARVVKVAEGWAVYYRK
jgi:hypothetical protein